MRIVTASDPNCSCILQIRNSCPNCNHSYFEAFRKGQEVSEYEDGNEENRDEYVISTPFIRCLKCGSEFDVSSQKIKYSPDKILALEQIGEREGDIGNIWAYSGGLPGLGKRR